MVDPRVTGALVTLAVIVVWGWALVDFSRTDEREMRTYPRQTWLLLLTFGSLMGALLWCAVGRPTSRRR